MTLERVDEMKMPPVVGRMYLVPTVTFEYEDIVRAWPVIGQRHTDADHLNFEDQHFHFDLRFVPQHYFQRWRSRGRDWSETLWIAPTEAIFGIVLPEFAKHVMAKREAHPLPATPVHQRLRCKRDFPFSTVGRHKGFASLHAAYADRAAIPTSDGFVCPHRHAPLGSLKPDCDGIIQCPLHGLRFHATTGAPAGQPSEDELQGAALNDWLGMNGEPPRPMRACRKISIFPPIVRTGGA